VILYAATEFRPHRPLSGRGPDDDFDRLLDVTNLGRKRDRVRGTDLQWEVPSGTEEIDRH
jgi:hypothetical protein